MGSGFEGIRGWQLAVAIGGVSLLAMAAVLTFLGVPDSQTTAYKLGAAFGSIVGTLALAAAGRWAWVNWGSGSGPVLVPETLLIAGAVSFVLALASLGQT